MIGSMFSNLVLSAATIVSFLLMLGAWKFWRRGGVDQKVILMVIAALVILGNVAIWSIPNDQGKSLASEVGKSG